MKTLLCLLLILLTHSTIEEKFILPKEKERFEFEMHVKENQNLLLQIDVYSGEGDRYLKGRVFDKRNVLIPIQTFRGFIDFTSVFSPRVEDVNFDGYDDFYYMWNMGNVNASYIVWVWNPEKNRFEHAKELEGLMNFSIDEEKQIVKSWSRGSAVSSIHQYYKYIDSKLECIRSLELAYPSKGFEKQKLICKDWIDGKLETIIEKDVPIDFVWGVEGISPEKLLEIDSETKQQVEEFWKYFYDIDYPEKKW